MYTMMSVVSVRVDKRVKERLERSGIEVSKEVKKHLEDLAWQLELKERLKRWEKFLDDIEQSHDLRIQVSGRDAHPQSRVMRPGA